MVLPWSVLWNSSHATVVQKETYTSVLLHLIYYLQQVVPEELVAMAERYEAWKARKDAQRDDRRGRPGGMGRRGRSHNQSSFI